VTIEAGPGELYTTQARAADVPALVELINGAYRGESSRRGWTNETDLVGGRRIDAATLEAIVANADEAMLVLRAQSGLFACAHVAPLGQGVATIALLTVRPALQASGLGRQMLAAAERHAQARLGARTIEITVVSAREELVAWYERRGYRATGELRPFPYNDERFGVPKRDGLTMLVMRRALAPQGPSDAA
jgi:ribosomal protein S18 acetylase RimI-like enzyme